MFLIPLVLGALALQLPFIAIVLLLLYLAKVADIGLQRPLVALGAFFIIPVIILLFDPSYSSALPALDSMMGVGLPALVFILALARWRRTTSAIAAAAVSLVIYGSLRSVIFSAHLAEIQALAQTQLQEWMPQLFEQQLYSQSIQIMNLIMPALWIAFQIIGLFLGLMLFHRQLQMPFIWAQIQFPWQYNLLFILALPLYLIKDLHILLLTIVIAGSVLPLIQGISLIINYLSRTIYNKVIRAVLLIVLLINSISYIFITILGFADIWLNLRKIETGGSPA
ncbi:MAG: hypothetical protein CVU49_09320 [Candidatus Cloacimonetes bacterium HGW-Cloacimonetes-2]|jgi:hypothetical protein|nr:MAG: hypothetical protein CVU49_09320 [Candidatus Cloacimonetes bacterium HGW-Cloacimonetes-2]